MDKQGIVTAQLARQVLHLEGSLTKDSAATLFLGFRRKGTPKFKSLDVNKISQIDTSGIAFLIAAILTFRIDDVDEPVKA